MRQSGTVIALVFSISIGLTGCAANRTAMGKVDQQALERRSFECLKAALQFEYNPVVRAQAVEAMESADSEAARPWIRLALLDEHSAVRFAGCVAVGRLQDHGALQSVRTCLIDKDASVRVAALFAVHRLGDTRRTGEIATYLLEYDDALVRRNAALVLGLLGEPGAIKMLAKAMKDGDTGVRHHALEGMARLGNAEAMQELKFMTNAGVGSEEVFALNALAETRDRRCEDTFLYKLGSATHIEARLAAARGLGNLGSDEGYDVALSALTTETPQRANDPNDPPDAQVLRVRQLAAAALGAIGRTDALRTLKTVLEDNRDPRIQVSAAGAIIEIADANAVVVPPFESTGSREGENE